MGRVLAQCAGQMCCSLLCSRLLGPSSHAGFCVQLLPAPEGSGQAGSMFLWHAWCSQFPVHMLCAMCSCWGRRAARRQATGGGHAEEGRVAGSIAAACLLLSLSHLLAFCIPPPRVNFGPCLGIVFCSGCNVHGGELPPAWLPHSALCLVTEMLSHSLKQ